MSTPDESRGDDAMLVCDPVVPILDIPPNEDLAPSDEILAAVAAMGEEEENTARASAVESLLDGSVASANEVENVVQEEEISSVEAAARVEATLQTTTTVEVTETSVLVTDIFRASTATSGDSTALLKREKAEDGTVATTGDEEESGPPSKKVKVAVDGEELPGDLAATGKPVQLGPKTFLSGVDMFKYFYDLLHAWVSNVDVNKYEFLVLSDLISKGHRDAEAKTGPGIQAFQVRFHPGWHSRCYYLVRTDGSVDDFSYRKCVDKIMPLPENLFSPSGDLLVEKLFGPEEDKWSKKSKRKDNFVDGRRSHGGQTNRGGRGGRGGRRGGGWSGY